MQNGNPITGNPVSQNKFQGVAHLDQLEAYGLKRPSSVEVAKATDGPHVLAAKEMHDRMNRRFDSSRVHRAVDYRDYIFGVEHQGQMGGTPAITLWYPKVLETTPEGIIVPYNQPLTAIDGETQTEARYMLRDGIRAGKIGRVLLRQDEVRDAVQESGTTNFAITIYHGVDSNWAQQVLKDYNAEAHPIDPRKATTFDHVGPLSSAINSAIVHAGLIRDGDVNLTGKKAGKKCAVAYQQILSAVGGYILNGEAAAPLTPANVRLLNKAGAKTMDDAAITQLGGIIRSRELAQAEAIVWQAVGHCMSRGQSSFNYAAVLQAYEGTKQSARGGPRMSPKARLAALVAAL